ncbi:hypothetical protein EDB85DRAFT_1897849 [Lactarius pseudohatsudake]|nr:hypothetical protein EDB85DRAFT_1897849 [Lactarius pseudohatsudake]
MAGVDNAELGKVLCEVLQNVTVSFSLNRLTTAQTQIPGPADRPYETPRPILLLMMPLCIFWRDRSVNGRVAPDGDIRANGSAWAENARMTTLRGLVAVGSVVAGELLPTNVVDGIEYAKLKSRGFVRVRERDHELLDELLGLLKTDPRVQR